MREFCFPYVSIASSGGEYFQVLFANHKESEDAYFLIQRQFESYGGGYFYVECHEPSLSGHYKIKNAQLGRNVFRLELVCQPAETVQIRFEAGDARYNKLRRVLRIMIPSSKLKID
jgi:hypothetical protein